MRWKSTALVAAGLLVAGDALVGQAGPNEPNGRPLAAADFRQDAPRGFGDRNNSWVQSMAWWHDALYAGTARQPACTSGFSIWNFVRLAVDEEFADTWFPYPSADPDLSCEPNGEDLELQAEIWRWQPSLDHWQRVFQSPLELDNPGPGPPEPAFPGKKLPYEITIRGMVPHTEPDGTEALYAFGVNSTVMWDRNQLPPPRILRTTDGTTFQPVPQTPGTFLGDLPHNDDHASFRSPESFGGKLFVISGPTFGQGSLIASADPAQGDDAWFLASPPGMVFYEMTAFNGWLYLGTLNLFEGYSVVKTRAEGDPPYEFVTVIPSGAGLGDAPSRSVVSMREYDGRLYVGTATQTELVRIHPDDTWDLVIGPPREIELPNGESEWKYPIGGLDAGFGQSLNDHAWQMVAADGSLFIGTYNVSTWYRNDPEKGSLLEDSLGAHLYRTDDGWYYSAVTTDGFADPTDPFGGPFDYGIRTMAATPHGVFVGTANDFYGLAVFRGEKDADSDSTSDPDCGCDLSSRGGPPGGRAPRVDTPRRLEVETSASGYPLLSWRAPHTAQTRIWRAEVKTIRIREDLSYLGWDLTTADGNKLLDTYIGPYEEIATIDQCSVVDEMMLEVNDRVIARSEGFVATGTLSSANTRIVGAAQVEFQAGDAILLKNGFSVEGGSFVATLNRRIRHHQTFSFIDSTVDPEKRYMYYVVAETCRGLSEASNLVAYPPLTPPMTFARLLTEVDRRLDLPIKTSVEVRIGVAQKWAASCRIDLATDGLTRLEVNPTLGGPRATDVRILVAKLARRLTLFDRHPQEVLSSEFCSSPDQDP